MPDPFMLHLYAALAEKERALISQRTKEALRAAKVRGVVLGNRTNLEDARRRGRESNARGAVDFAEKVKPAIQPLLDRGVSYRQIALRLNKMRVPTARGGVWQAMQVSNIVKRLLAMEANQAR